MADPRDVTGVWYGRYRGDYCGQDNSFIAMFADAGGMFDGSISEPDEDNGSVRRAHVQGRRGGATIRFVKQYDGSGGFAHAVYYSGKIDAEGTLINGIWAVDWLRGTFTMQRVKFDEAELEDEEEIELHDLQSQVQHP
jgi:hypothetical protein